MTQVASPTWSFLSSVRRCHCVACTSTDILPKQTVSYLPVGDLKKLTAAQLVDHVMAADRDTAAKQTSKIMSHINFVSTYAFSKLLTEQLVDDPATLPGVSKVIVRPSLISPVAIEPYKG